MRPYFRHLPGMPMSVPFLSHLRGCQRSRGQSLTEFALVGPVLLLILLVGIDAGRLFFGWVNLQNTARIGANFAGNHPKAWNVVGGSSQDRVLYQTQIQNDASVINCMLPDPLPAPTFPGGQDFGDLAVVGLDCEFDVLTPIVGAIVGQSVTLSADAKFPIRTGTIAGITVPPPGPIPTPSPTPTATPTPTPACPTVSFTATDSSNPGNPHRMSFSGSISPSSSGWTWTWSGAFSATGQNQNNRNFPASGPITVTLTVTKAPCSVSTTQVVNVP